MIVVGITRCFVNYTRRRPVAMISPSGEVWSGGGGGGGGGGAVGGGEKT